MQIACILQTGAALQGPLRRLAPAVSVTDKPLPVDTPRGDIVLGAEPAVVVEEAAPASYARGLATIGGITEQCLPTFASQSRFCTVNNHRDPRQQLWPPPWRQRQQQQDPGGPRGARALEDLGRT